MQVYQRCLKRLGIAQIVITLVDILLSSLLYRLFDFDVQLEAHKAKVICAVLQHTVELLSGVTALILYRRIASVRLLSCLELSYLILLTVLKVIAVTIGAENTFIDSQLCVNALLLLTIHQMRLTEYTRRVARGGRACVLDLRLTGPEQWFTPLLVGPRFRLNSDVADSIDRFLEAQITHAPLEINLHGLSGLSEAMRDTMQDVLRDHYTDESLRIERYIAARYQRALLLIIISIVMLEIWTNIYGANAVNVTTIVLSNIAVFSLWQVGTVYLERKDAREKLIRATIAGTARITVL